MERPSKRILIIDNNFSSPSSLSSSINSERDPKHAKPAFLVLAPDENNPRSRIAIDAVGLFFLK